MYENVNLFALPFDHFHRKGILSDYYYGFLKALKQIHKEKELSDILRNAICDDILLKCLQKKVSGPFDHIVNFYRTYSRDDLFNFPGAINSEILIHPRLFFLLKELDPFLADPETKDLIVDKYIEIRTELERASNGDFTLYHVLIHPKFKIFLESLKLKIISC